MTEVKKEEAGFPELVIKKQQMLVAGLRILKNIVEDCQEEPEQPGLPIMKNNDQRKEWLRNYKIWGLWYTDTKHAESSAQMAVRVAAAAAQAAVRAAAHIHAVQDALHQ